MSAPTTGTPAFLMGAVSLASAAQEMTKVLGSPLITTLVLGAVLSQLPPALSTISEKDIKTFCTVFLRVHGYLFLPFISEGGGSVDLVA